MQLKTYQQKTLDLLRDYLEAVPLYGARDAFERIRANNPRPQLKSRRALFQPLDGLPDVPYVCLRLPTGGGKTLLCAHSIQLAANALDRNLPLVLWMMPSNIIKQQTLDTLKNPHHPNHLALQHTFGDAFRVFDIADFAHIRPQDIANNTCIIVSTFASLRVDNTEGRRVYDHHEELEGHFSRIAPDTPNLERKDDDGQIKYSFVNLLNVQRPLVLVDEAHNAKSELSLKVLQRLNPAAVIEYTATPAKNSNILESVSAQELKDEEMIKLPIVFQWHAGWHEAVAASIQTRNRLEQLAARDSRYLRPLLLIQAENKNGEVTVSTLKEHLINQENIPADQIVIATGEQRELDGLNLFDPYCQVRIIITVQALKEGWDCPFAYVLCSVASTRSTTAVEQLLGRVLRMPYAQSRDVPELNRAYAHVSGQSWPHAVSHMEDRLLSMGFEQQEADRYLDMQQELAVNTANQDAGPLFANAAEAGPFSVPLSHAPDISTLEADEQARLTLEARDGYVVLQVNSPDAALLGKVAAAVRDGKDRREVQLRADKWLRQHPSNTTPAERGEPFTVPQLCLMLDDITLTLEVEHCLGIGGWNPLDDYRPIGKDEFSADENTKVWLVDVAGEKLRVQPRKEQQLPLDGVPTEMDITDLVVNMEPALSLKLHGQYMAEGSLRKYLLNTLQDLLQRDDMDLPTLIRARQVLEKIIYERLLAARKQAYSGAFEQQLFTDDGRVCVSLDQYTFTFPKDYPLGPRYAGRTLFENHYYREIGDMNNEEAGCAQDIDQYEKVKHWVRNIEKQERHSFWLPTSGPKFYPDFVAQLDDGRILVVEYKGDHLDNPVTLEKTAVGKAWAKASGNLFLMAFARDKSGRNVFAQLRHLLG